MTQGAEAVGGSFAGRMAVVGAGARTSLGGDLASSAAAARAGLCAFADHPYMIDQAGFSMAVARDTGLPPELGRFERHAQLAASAVADSMQALARDGVAPVGIVLCLALREDDAAQPQVRLIVDAIGAAVAPCGRIVRLHVCPGRHAAGIAAVLAAEATSREGFEGYALVVGVESWLDAHTLEWLDEQALLRVPSRPFGFVPGEGAAAVLLALAAQAAVAPGTLRLEAAALGLETMMQADQPRLGLALTAAARRVLHPLPTLQRSADVLYTDINGLPERADEVGYCVVRVREFLRAGLRTVVPAEWFGDVGAATVPLMIALAATAAAKGYAGGSSLLFLVQGLGGERGALLASVIEPGGQQ